MAAKVSKNFARDMRKDLFIKTLRLSAAQTDKFTIPSLESRITTDTYHVHGFINMMQRMGVRAPILLAGGIVITMIMDFRLSLVMTAILPLIFATVYFVRRKGVPLYENVQKAVDSMIRVVREDAQGIRVIKALSKKEFATLSKDAEEEMKKIKAFFEIIFPTHISTVLLYYIVSQNHHFFKVYP